jgi:ubiquinone/menaquinone biosynthesis C-methylase UbiE
MDDVGFPVDATNAAQAGDWDGPDGEYWATYYQAYERMLGVFDEPLLEAAHVDPDSRCLDLGCGTGATSRALAVRAADGSVLGIDLSTPLLAIARANADRAGLTHLSFVQGDAQVYPFEDAAYDVVVSRMGSMFFGDPPVAFANLARSMRPGGRLSLAVWQEVAANGWLTAIDAALEETRESPDSVAERYSPGPFSLADSELVRSLLGDAGFTDIHLEPQHLPLSFGTVADAREFLDSWIDEDLGAGARRRVTESIEVLLAKHERGGAVHLPSATWLVTATR